MAKELPYFRFYVQEWQNGDISLETYELQGLFIQICGFYWLKDCSITLALLNKKFKEPELVQELIDLNIIKYEKRHDKIQIEFLNNQYDLLSEKRKRRQIAGSKGGKAKALLKQKPSYKDKDKDKEKDKEKDPYKLFDFPDARKKEYWVKWMEYRKEIKKPIKTKSTLEALYKKFNDKSLEDIMHVIDNSISNGWQGLFWDRKKDSKPTKLQEAEERDARIREEYRAKMRERSNNE